VAHQALEGIEPHGEDILIQGKIFRVNAFSQWYIIRVWSSGALSCGHRKSDGSNKSVRTYVEYEHTSITCLILYRYAADIVEKRLESAKLIGADVIINCQTEDLRETSE
jgi:hypothetical protein